MPASDVRIVAFGRPERDDPQSSVLIAATALGASTNLVTSSEGEDFSSMDHGSIDWSAALEGSHWLVTSASTALEGESARYAWGAGMTFGEREGSRTVMVADLPEDLSRLAECWGAVIERIRQVHVLFIDPEALDLISRVHRGWQRGSGGARPRLGQSTSRPFSRSVRLAGSLHLRATRCGPWQRGRGKSGQRGGNGGFDPSLTPLAETPFEGGPVRPDPRGARACH